MTAPKRSNGHAMSAERAADRSGCATAAACRRGGHGRRLASCHHDLAIEAEHVEQHAAVIDIARTGGDGARCFALLLSVEALFGLDPLDVSLRDGRAIR
jgi:hypothetical protein